MITLIPVSLKSDRHECNIIQSLRTGWNSVTVPNFFLLLVASASLRDRIHGVGRVRSSAFVQLTVNPFFFFLITLSYQEILLCEQTGCLLLDFTCISPVVAHLALQVF